MILAKADGLPIFTVYTWSLSVCLHAYMEPLNATTPVGILSYYRPSWKKDCLERGRSFGIPTHLLGLLGMNDTRERPKLVTAGGHHEAKLLWLATVRATWRYEKCNIQSMFRPSIHLQLLVVVETVAISDDNGPVVRILAR